MTVNIPASALPRSTTRIGAVSLRSGGTFNMSTILTFAARNFALLGFVLLATPSQASSIVDAGFVADAIQRGAIVWDVRAATAYRDGHIPGAVNIDDPIRVLRNPNTEEFIELAQIERILGAAGIDPAREIVVYSTRGSAAAYFSHFAVQYFGGANAYVFHDGIDGWREAGHPIATAETRLPPLVVKITPNTALTVSTAEMLSRSKDENVQIIDARTPAEFAGNDIRAIRGGHIPRAINIPYEENWVDPATAGKLTRRQVANNAGMSLKSTADLRNIYAKLNPNRETIVYCQSGTRASETAAVLRDLGFNNVKVYKSSWLGYAAKLDAPAENEAFLNVGALNARLAAMQARLEALEKELAEARQKSSK
jgi:thiosulfate/3-mercaptopyruvate sulfurtransferase